MKHFTIEELTHSDTAIGHGIANNPGAVERENLRRLAERVLDPARERLGAPIYVNSGYRNCAVNRLVGGARRSYHLQGRAADLDTRSGRNAELMRILKKNNVYVLGEIKQNAANWDNRRVFNILGLLREYDAKSKGMNAGGASDGELLRELLLKIFLL